MTIKYIPNKEKRKKEKVNSWMTWPIVFVYMRVSVILACLNCFRIYLLGHHIFIIIHLVCLIKCENGLSDRTLDTSTRQMLSVYSICVIIDHYRYFYDEIDSQNKLSKLIRWENKVILITNCLGVTLMNFFCFLFSVFRHFCIVRYLN